MNISFKEVISAMIKAIDVMNPILKNHHRRTAIMAYHIGVQHGLDTKSLSNLIIAATLHDVGALTVEDESALIKLDVEEPFHHCILGASMLSSYDAFAQVSHIIKNHHMHYDDYINDPLINTTCSELSLILHLADRIEILTQKDRLSLYQGV